MSKRNQKRILICVVILLLIGIAGVIVYNVCKAKGPVIDAGIDDFDENYTSIKSAKADPFMNIDGVLDEKEWSGKQVFVNRFSDDLTMTGPNLEVITHLTEKGLYVGVNIFDSNVVYNGLNAHLKNSTLLLSIAPGTAESKSDIHKVYMDAGRIVSTTNANVPSCAYGVKVDGEVNSGETEKMTVELFLPWKSIGMKTPENLDTTEVLLYPCYNAVFKGETTARQLRALPYNGMDPSAFWRFSQVGYVDVDAENAVIGDSKYGVAKLGSWDVSNVTMNTSKSDDYTQVYKGSVKPVWGLYNLAYLTKASASSYAFEATVVPVSSNDTTGNSAWASLAAAIPGGKLMSLRLYLTKSNFGTGEDGQNNQTKVKVTRAFSDYNNGIHEPSTITNYENAKFDGQEGVKLKFIKDGAKYYYYVDGVLVWSGSESRANGESMPVFFSSNCEIKYQDIRWTTFDGRQAELLKEFERSNTCLVETEVEGSGEITADSIAVTKGDSATITVSAMPEYILTDLLVNGKSVMSDFKKNAFFEGILNKYTIQNIKEHITVKAVFEKYEGVAVSGKVSIVGEKSSDDIAETKIAAFLADKRVLVFSSAVNADGTYTISLPSGAYTKFYFMNPRYEQIFYRFSNGSALKIGSKPLANKNFVLTYPTFDSFVKGPDLETGNWYIVDNGKYTAVAPNGANDYSTAYFRDSGSNDFVVRTTVKAEPGALVGAMINGTYKGHSGYQMLVGFTCKGNYANTLFGWHATARPVNWIGTTIGEFQGNTTVYPEDNEYDLIVAKKDDSIVLYVNGVRIKEWSGKVKDYDGNEFDLAKFTPGKVGLSIRGTKGATFSNYSYSAKSADVTNIFCRKVTFSNLPDGVTVTSNGKTIKSGAMVRYGTDVIVKFPAKAGYVYAVTVNGKSIPVAVTKGEATFTIEEASTISVSVKPAYAVSGTVVGKANGSVTATNTTTGEVYIYDGALKNGAYTVQVPDGTYNLYFDCGSRDGLIPSVTVSGKAVSGQNLEKTYQKLTDEYMGAKPIETSGMIDNGVYYLSGVNNGNANSIAYFNSATEPVNDFMISTRVQTDGGQVGIMMYGYDGDKNNPDVQINLQSNGYLTFYGWGIGWQDGGFINTSKYNPQDFELMVVRKGNKIKVYIDDMLVKTWDGTGMVNIAQLTNLRVGLLVRGKVGATYSDYYMTTKAEDINKVLNRTVTFGNLPSGVTVSVGGKTIQSGASIEYGTEITVNCPVNADKVYIITVNGQGLLVKKGKAKFELTEDAQIKVSAERAYKVSGSVTGQSSGNITATETTTGFAFVYENVLKKDGSYEISLPSGTYKLYFDCGSRDGMISGVTVTDAAVKNQNLEKTYQKLTAEYMGASSIETSGLQDNGVYYLSGVENGNANAIAYFNSTSNPVDDFMISTRVQTDGGQAGIMMYGYDGNANNPDVQINLQSNGYLSFYGWGIGWQDGVNLNTTKYNPKDFVLTVLRKGNMIQVYIDGMLMKTWDGTGNIDIEQLTDLRVGLLARGKVGVTYSDYYMSTNAIVTFENLPTGVTVSVGGATITSGASVSYGEEVSVSCPTVSDKVYSVIVNGKAVTVENGIAKFTLMEDVTIEVSEKQIYQVSGTVSGVTSGSITATEKTSGEVFKFTDALTNGSYEISLPSGTYKLYFDCGDTEGLISTVTVADEAVTNQNLDKTYQKLRVYKDGADGTAEWNLTKNGRYEVKTSNEDVNAISMGYFDTVDNFGTTDFVISTKVEHSAKTGVLSGLAISGTLGDKTETALFGLVNWGNAAVYPMTQAKWMGILTLADDYNRSNYELTIVKKGDTITFFIDQVQYVQWKLNVDGYDFSSMTDVKVGLGIYRMYDVTFSDYSYSTEATDIDDALNRTFAVSGTVGGVTSGSITATETTTGNVLTFADVLKEDGSYEIQLPNGTYKLYFDCGKMEGLIPSVTVSGAAVTEQNLKKTYQKLSIYKFGTAGTAKWVLTQNGRYEVQTSNQDVNAISMGYFDIVDNFSTTDFVIRTKVEHSASTGVLSGLAINGMMNGKEETAVFGFVNKSGNAVVHAMTIDKWIGTINVADNSNRMSYELTIVKKGDTITCLIDGVKCAQWNLTVEGYDFGSMTNVKIGLGIYRIYDVVFSDYSYSTETADINNALNTTAVITYQIREAMATLLRRRFFGLW